MGLPINQIICGDCLEVMKGWPDKSIQCCVTSPPYWGLRDYGVEGQLGLEKTPEEYVTKMVEVFREVKRVLRDDGTLWLNLGDSYSTGGRGGQWVGDEHEQQSRGWQSAPPGLKHKDLCGIPWRVAFALQSDGWYLRQDIIWHKPNPMPESCTDRCTKSHEYLFLLTKKPRYFYDAQAIAEPCVESNASRPRMGQGPNTQYNQKRASWNGSAFDKGKTFIHQEERCQKRSGTGVGFGHGTDKESRNRERVNTGTTDGTKNKRSVWTVPTKSFKDAHFATFPPKLIEPCILAGTSKKGACPECGAPWDRVVEKEVNTTGRGRDHIAGGDSTIGQGWEDTPRATLQTKTTGWRPTCECSFEVHAVPGDGTGIATPCPVPCVVFDPFMGAGTVGVVAAQHGRDYVGTELNPEYCEIARSRLEAVDTGVPVKEALRGQRALFP